MRMQHTTCTIPCMRPHHSLMQQGRGRRVRRWGPAPSRMVTPAALSSWKGDARRKSRTFSRIASAFPPGSSRRPAVAPSFTFVSACAGTARALV